MGRSLRFTDAVNRRADLLTALERHAGVDTAAARVVELVADAVTARAMAAAGVEAATPDTLAEVVASGPPVAALTCSSLRRMSPPVVRRVLTDARLLLPEGAALAVHLDYQVHGIDHHRLRHRGYLVLLSCAGWDLVDAALDRVPLRTLRRAGFDGAAAGWAPDDVAVREASLVLVGRRNRAVHFRAPAVPVRAALSRSDQKSAAATVPAS